MLRPNRKGRPRPAPPLPQCDFTLKTEYPTPSCCTDSKLVGTGSHIAICHTPSVPSWILK